MRVLIAGAGELGIQTACRLAGAGCDVTLLTDRSADMIARGAVMSTQVIVGPALRRQRDAGLDLWPGAPRITGLDFGVVDAGRRISGWNGALDEPAVSVDQRLRFSSWMALLEDLGGHLELGEVTVESVDRLADPGTAAGYDLTVIASARGGLGGLFRQTSLRAPQRHLAVAYLDGVDDDPDGQVAMRLMPGLGEALLIPAVTAAGPCHILLIEARPNAPLDVFTGVTDPQRRVQTVLSLLRTHLPDLYQRCDRAALTDEGGTLVGAVEPVTRHPVGTLPCGVPVLAGGDVVSRTDPLGAQGANAATHAAALYADAILRNAGPFDAQWMTATAGLWITSYAEPAQLFTDALLDPPPAVGQLLADAEYQPTVADRIVNGFAHPADLVRALAQPDTLASSSE